MFLYKLSRTTSVSMTATIHVQLHATRSTRTIVGHRAMHPLIQSLSATQSALGLHFLAKSESARSSACHLQVTVGNLGFRHPSKHESGETPPPVLSSQAYLATSDIENGCDRRKFPTFNPIASSPVSFAAEPNFPGTGCVRTISIVERLMSDLTGQLI